MTADGWTDDADDLDKTLKTFRCPDCGALKDVPAYGDQVLQKLCPACEVTDR